MEDEVQQAPTSGRFGYRRVSITEGSDCPPSLSSTRLRNILTNTEDFYVKRDANFHTFENWYTKVHTEIHESTLHTTDDEVLTPINLPTHMINMATAMSVQETPSIEVLVEGNSKQKSKRGNKAEKVFMGILQTNGQQMGRDLLYDYLHNMYKYGWGVLSVFWDQSRAPKGFKSDVANMLMPASPDAQHFGGDNPEDSMPIVVEAPSPADIYPIPGGHRERWKGVFKRWHMRWADCEDYFAVELPRTMEDDDPDYSSQDDQPVTVYDVWMWAGTGIYHTIVCTGIPIYAYKTVRGGKRIRYTEVEDTLAYIKQPCHMKEYKRLPYEITFCFPTTAKTGEHFGLSLLYSVIDAVGAAERLASRQEMVLDAYLDPITLASYDSEMGNNAVPPKVTKQPGGVIFLDKAQGHEVSYLQWQGMPPDAEKLREMWLTQAKEYGFDPQVEGQSGLDQIVKKAGILAKIMVPIQQAQSGLAMTHARIAHLLSAKVGEKELLVRGQYTVNDESKAYAMKVKGSEMTDMQHAKFTIRARFPFEELQNMAAAQAGVASKLISADRARTKYLGIDDSQAEAERIEEETIERSEKWDAFIEKFIEMATMQLQQKMMTQAAPAAGDPAVAGQPDLSQGQGLLEQLGQASGAPNMMPTEDPMRATGNVPGQLPPNGSLQQTQQQKGPGRPPLS